MTKNTLARFDGENGVELIIDTVTGESFATVSGYARMAGKDKSTISRRLQTVASNTVKQAEIQTQGGLQGVALISEDLITEWLPKDNPEMATQLMKLGVRVFLHKLAGYNIESTATKNEVKPLPSRDMVDYIKAAEVLPNLKVNPLLKQLLEDGLTDELELHRNQKLLGGDRQKKEYTIVKVRARELGKSPEDIGNGASLGRFVAKFIPVAFKKRIGEFEVNHFEVTPELDEVILAYFR